MRGEKSMRNYEIKLYENTEPDTICLPVVYPPPLQSYLPLSIVSNIATANMQNLNWIMHNFVQLFKYKTLDKIESFPIQQFMYTNQSMIFCREITKEVIEIKRINVIEDIINYIDHHQYVVIYLDEKLIPGTRNYQKQSMLHSQFIFGYNKEKKIFKVMNFSNTSSKIDIIDVSFLDISNNFYSDELKSWYTNKRDPYVRNKEFQMYILSYCDNIRVRDISLNIDVIKNQIKQYLYSIDSSIYTTYFTGVLPGTWGVNVYNEIKKLLLEKNKVDTRIFYLLYEHKLFMQYRINYINEHIAEKYYAVVKLAEMLKMFSLKYIITYDDKMLKKMITILNKIETEECYILEQLELSS